MVLPRLRSTETTVSDVLIAELTFLFSRHVAAVSGNKLVMHCLDNGQKPFDEVLGELVSIAEDEAATFAQSHWQHHQYTSFKNSPASDNLERKLDSNSPEEKRAASFCQTMIDELSQRYPNSKRIFLKK